MSTSDLIAVRETLVVACKVKRHSLNNLMFSGNSYAVLGGGMRLLSTYKQY